MNYCFSFCSVEMAVREGDSNFSNQMGSEIIPCYVHIGIERARLTNCEHCKRRAYLRVFDTLVETLCDTSLTLAWRQECYSFIKKLLPLLFEVLDSTSYAKKVSQSQTLYNYFVESALFNIDMETKRKSTGSVAKKS